MIQMHNPRKITKTIRILIQVYMHINYLKLSFYYIINYQLVQSLFNRIGV